MKAGGYMSETWEWKPRTTWWERRRPPWWLWALLALTIWTAIELCR